MGNPELGSTLEVYYEVEFTFKYEGCQPRTFEYFYSFS